MSIRRKTTRSKPTRASPVRSPSRSPDPPGAACCPFPSLFQDSAAPIVCLSSSLRILAFNREAEHIHGARLRDVIGKSYLTRFVPSAFRAPFLSVLKKLLAGGRKMEFEAPLSSGGKHWVHWALSPVRGDKGKPAGVIAIGRDISGHKRLEIKANLSPTEKRIIETSLEGILVLDNKARVSYVNKRMSGLLGFSSRYMLGRSLFDFVDGREQKKARAKFKRRMHGIKEVFSLSLRRKDGSILFADLSANPIMDENGRFIGAIDMVSDVTERRKLEEDLRLAGVYNRSLIEVSLDPLVTISAEGKVTDVNAATEAVTGCSRGELIGTDFSEYFTEPKLARAGYKQVFERGFVRDYPLAIRHKNGAVAYVLYNAAVFKDEAGVVQGVFAAARDVTERKKAEDTLRESEAWLREAQRLAHIGNWKLDLVTNGLTWSDEIFRIFEIDKEHFGASYDAFLAGIHPDDRDAVNAAYTQSLKTHKPYTITHRLLMRDGRVKYVHEQCETYYSSEGKPLQSVGTVQDITELKQAEIEREQFFKFFQISPDIMVIADPNGAFKKVNPAALALLGYSEDELISKPFVDFIYSDDKQPTIDEMARQVKLGSSLNFENRYICKDGTLRWLSWSANYNKAEGITYATARDITRRKKLEEDLRLAGVYNRSLIEVSLDPLVTISAEGKVTDVNAATEAVTGCSRGELIGTDFSDYFTEPKLARDGYKQVFERGFVRDYPLAIRHKNGKVTDVLYNAAVFKDEAGIVQGVFAAARDVTERKKAEAIVAGYAAKLEREVAERTAELRAEKEKVVDLSAAKDEFIRNISHELKTPLSAILLGLSLIKGNRVSDEMLAVFRRNTDRLARSIDQILQLSKLERAELKRDNVDLKGLVQSLCDESSSFVKLKGISLDFEDDPVTVLGDADLLRLAVDNLLSNAIKFTDKGGVRVSLKANEGMAHLKVKDTGIGISPSDLKKLFSNFFKANPSAPGTGMGLALTRQIIEKHGGSIVVQSNMGQGSVFEILLPLKGKP